MWLRAGCAVGVALATVLGCQRGTDAGGAGAAHSVRSTWRLAARTVLAAATLPPNLGTDEGVKATLHLSRALHAAMLFPCTIHEMRSTKGISTPEAQWLIELAAENDA